VRRPEPQELGTESKSPARQWVVTEDYSLGLSLERTLRRLDPRHSSVWLMFESEGVINHPKASKSERMPV
jgi:hypothetical protein